MIKINSYKSKSNESKSNFDSTFNSTFSFITSKSKIFPNIKEHKKKENLYKNKKYVKFRVKNIINELDKSYSFRKLLNQKNKEFYNIQNKNQKNFLNKSKSINNFSNFRKNIMRDFGISNLNSKKNLIDISKKNYFDFNYLLINKNIELENKIINISKKFDELKNKEEYEINYNNNQNNNNNQNKNHLIKEIDYNKLSKQCLNEFYKLKSLKRKNDNISKFNEIKNLDCSDYEDLNLINKETILKKNLGLISNKNLNRIIKVFNINKYNFDLENDDLGDKNIKLLKNNLKNIELLVHSKFNEKQPKFIKERLRNETIKKFRSLSGELF